MRISIGADHRGFEFKEKIKAILKKLKYDIDDVGTNSSKVSCDYPKVAYKVAKNVASGKSDRGVLVCMSGVGQAMAANKVKGAYAALVLNKEMAALSRQHNDSNVLVLSAKFIEENELENIVKTWFNTSFEGGRHERRTQQIKMIEEGKDPS